MTPGPLTAYHRLIESGAIRPDPVQETAAARLQSLADDLFPYAQQMGHEGWLARLSMGRKRLSTPRGIYLHGGVGRGKTMLMDLFFNNAEVERRKRVHFHSFMLEVHTRVHRFREAVKAGRVAESRDPLKALARVIVDQAWLLCFDELHVTNIADAMILGRLFERCSSRDRRRHVQPPARRLTRATQRELLFPSSADRAAARRSTRFRRRLPLERMRSVESYLTPPIRKRRRLEAAFRALTAGVEAGPWRVRSKAHP